MVNLQSVLDVLSAACREAVCRYDLGAVQELRLREGRPPYLKTVSGERAVPLQNGIGTVTREDLEQILAAAARHSVYSAQEALGEGYLTLPGGHRIGICGTLAERGGKRAMKELSSLNIRIAHDIWIDPVRVGQALTDSLLIVGPPGSGKTTLLRACIRALSRNGVCVGVADERGEIGAYPLGEHVDVLCGCSKQEGMERLLRCMGPSWIAVDEISAESDILALEKLSYCGVRLLATAHAAGMDELRQRKLYRRLLETGVFSNALILRTDQTFSQERIML